MRRYSTPLMISEKLSEQYVSSFSSPDPKYKIDDPKEFFSTEESKNSPQLEDIYFTKEMIVDAIKDIKNNSAPGTDHFPAILMKECADELSEPLLILWRHSLDSGDIAPLLKSAVICPILNPGAQKSSKIV